MHTYIIHKPTHTHTYFIYIYIYMCHTLNFNPCVCPCVMTTCETEVQVINAEWLSISLCLHSVYELHVNCIYWHVRRLEYDHSRHSISSPRDLNVADIFLPINLQTSCASQKYYPRGDCLLWLWCSDAAGIRFSWEVYGIYQHGWKDCAHESTGCKITSWI